MSSKVPTLIIIPRVEMRQENLSIDRVTNISENFVEMVRDLRPCDGFIQI